MQYWLLKSDPETYSIDNLKKDINTVWDGVRNYQARNYLAQMKKGDGVLIYHSGSEKAIMGTAVVSKESFQDPTSQDEPWVAVEIQFKSKSNTMLSLEAMKLIPELSNLALFKQSRLSVMPINSDEFAIISKLIK